MYNECKVIDFKKAEKRAKFNDFKNTVKAKINDTWFWLEQNKELVMVIGPACLGGVAALTKCIGKNINLKKEAMNKDLYCYDRSLGCYLHLKRKLNNNDFVQINARKRNGEKLVDILNSMNLLR